MQDILLAGIKKKKKGIRKTATTQLMSSLGTASFHSISTEEIPENEDAAAKLTRLKKQIAGMEEVNLKLDSYINKKEKSLDIFQKLQRSQG
jgi:hypothetical protein